VIFLKKKICWGLFALFASFGAKRGKNGAKKRTIIFL